MTNALPRALCMLWITAGLMPAFALVAGIGQTSLGDYDTFVPAKQPTLRAIDAIRLAEQLAGPRLERRSAKSTAILVSIISGRILPVDLQSNVAFSAIKDGDLYSFQQWSQKMEGRLVWAVRVSYQHFGTTYLIDAVTGEDVGYK